MDLLELIKTRRSIRKYTDKVISNEDIEKIVDAALYAPSTKNKQDRKIVVITGKDNIDKVTNAMKSATINAVEEHQKMYMKRATNPNYTVNFDSPLFIICTANRLEGNPEADCAVMLQNMFLMAHSLGIGSVWINQLKPINDVPEFRKFLTKLGIPEEHNIYGAAAFGYNSATHPKAYERKNDQVIFANNLLSSL